MQVVNIEVSKLSILPKAEELIPVMNDLEWKDFKESVKKDGVKVPIHINQDNQVLDGRHRLQACKELGIKTIHAIKSEYTEEQSLEFVRDTAIERRNLTKEQKLNIILETEELVKSIYEEGKKKKTGRPKKEEKFSSFDENINKKPHNSIKEIAEMAGTSAIQVSRAKKLKKEDPQLYKDVVDGKKTIYTAYYELPTVKKDHLKKSKKQEKSIERGDTDVKPSKPKQFNQQPPTLTKEEVEKEMRGANITTLFNHCNELAGFVIRHEDFEDIVNEAMEKDSASFKDFIDPLEKTLKIIKSGGNSIVS